MFGRLSVRQHVLELLTTRLQLVQQWDSIPEIQAQEIRRPIFITGMPRSGSTFLHSLLGQDPANRAPQVWEAMFPYRVLGQEQSKTSSLINKTENKLRWFRWLAPKFDAIHPISATLSQECIAILSYTFYSDEFVTMFRVPSYEKWLRRQDMSGAYGFHKCFLKHLQWHDPMKRWVLKSPDHVYGLEALFKIYPDACVIHMHRDPLKVLASTASLTAVLQGAFSKRIDMFEIGAHEVLALNNLLQRGMAFRDGHAELKDQFLDVHYLEFIRDPVATVRTIYQHFGWRLTTVAEERMRAFLSAWPREQLRNHAYDLADFGLNRINTDRLFEPYRDRFAIQCEPRASGPIDKGPLPEAAEGCIPKKWHNPLSH